MTVIEDKFSAKFEEVAANIKHRGAYYQEDASEKDMEIPPFIEKKIKSA